MMKMSLNLDVMTQLINSLDMWWIVSNSIDYDFIKVLNRSSELQEIKAQFYEILNRDLALREKK